jgi:hypothetical protein
VKWLFAAAKAPLPLDQVEVLNMRVQTAADVTAALLRPELTPNLPAVKVAAGPPPELPKPNPESSVPVPAAF